MKSLCAAVAVGMTSALSAVEFSAFENPAKEHRPETWFHLIGGNVAKPGLDADLDALRDAGISGIQLFHGQIGNCKWPGVEPQIQCLGADWDDMIRHAAEGCAKRGLSFKMQNCPGWSMSGGPWIAPSNAMRELVFSRIDVQGGGRVSARLPDPPDVKMNDRNQDYREICVLAFPTPEGDAAEVFARSTPDEQSDKDGVLRLVYRFEKPLAFRSVTIPSPKSMNPGWSYHIALSVRVNDGDEIAMPQSNWQDYPGITLALGEAVDHKPSEANPFPRGYRYDYVNADALLSRISVKDGLFTTPEGVSWKVLWVPDARWMSDKVKAKLTRLAADGGRIEYGRPADVVRGIAPDVVVGPDAKGRVISDWRKEWNEEMVEWLHRRGDSSDWYFAAANNNDGYEGEVTFRATGAAEIWDPATGTRRAADVTRRTSSTTTVRLSLASAESVFVVFGGKSGISEKPGISGVSGISGISGWELSFPAGWGAPASMKLDRLVSWHELPIGEEGRRFSGTATYTTAFSAKAGEGVTLDLGRVETAATVYVNGKKVRALWSEPYRCDIDGSLVKDGANELKIEVTSTWHNRLAYDSGLPEAERKTWTIAAPGKNSPLQPSGLFGPVSIR